MTRGHKLQTEISSKGGVKTLSSKLRTNDKLLNACIWQSRRNALALEFIYSAQLHVYTHAD